MRCPVASAPSRPLPKYVYRALRKDEEEPWRLRTPAERLKNLTYDQLRQLVILAVSGGNHKRSPFLHTSVNFLRIKTLLCERKHLYSGVVVRIDLQDFGHDDIVDISTTQRQQAWFFEDRSMSPAQEEALYNCRRWGDKDREVLLLKKPMLERVWTMDLRTGSPVACTKDPPLLDM